MARRCSRVPAWRAPCDARSTNSDRLSRGERGRGVQLREQIGAARRAEQEQLGILMARPCRQESRRAAAALARLDDHVGVDAAEAEAGNAGDGATAGRRHGGVQGRIHAIADLVEHRVGDLAADMGRHDPGVERVHRLDQAGEAGGGLGVADVGLDRTDRQWLPASLDQARQGPDLGRIADRGSGAVRLHHHQVRRIGIGLGVGPREGAILAVAVGPGQAPRAVGRDATGRKVIGLVPRRAEFA